MPRTLTLSLCLMIVPLALPGCESTHPEPTMGPQSARYITSAYRRSFRSNVAPPTEAGRPVAPLTQVAPFTHVEPPQVAPPQVEPPQVEPAPRPPLPVAPRAKAHAPTPRPTPTPATAAPAAAPERRPAGLPEPLRWAKRDFDKLGSRTPAPSVPKRRFFRMRLTELDGTPVTAREVRPVLRSMVGVQDVVLNETTGTAVVVVNPEIEAQAVVKHLEGRYRATIVR